MAQQDTMRHNTYLQRLFCYLCNQATKVCGFRCRVQCENPPARNTGVESKLCLQSSHRLGLAVGAVSSPAAEMGSQHAKAQPGCLDRRPTETLSEQAVAVPIAAVAAHQEPPLLPPQRPEHKVGCAHPLVGPPCRFCTPPCRLCTFLVGPPCRLCTPSFRAPL